MAGDIGIAESIVRPAPPGVAAAAAPVLHEYGSSFQIRIGAPPPGASMAALLSESALSPNEQLGLSALRLRESADYIAQKQKRPYAARAWSDGPTPLHAREQPIVGDGTDGSAGGAGGPSGGIVAAPLARRLSGRVAVGVIMVSGPGQLALANTQQVKIAAEVQNGLSWLGAQSPARDVTWVHDSRHVTVNVAEATGPTGSQTRYEHFEAPWRDAALSALGFPSGRTGVNAYIAALKADKAADAAYCAFFTHYALNHFAYCTGPYLVMHFANDGWEPDNLDRVFAHESGHVFGAPDEYAVSNCNCGGSHGFFGKPNVNCENCAPGTGVQCIMKRNSWAMCSMTPYHLGFKGLPDEAPVLSSHIA